MEGPVPTAVPKSSDGEICSASKPLEKEHGFRLRGALEWAKREWRIVCELALLIIMIVVVWGLLSLPVVFYYTTPDEEVNGTLMGLTVFSNASDGGTRNNASGLCFNKYGGSHCLLSLKAFAACNSPESESTDLYISNSVMDQISAEAAIGNLISALNLLIQPSDECRSAVIPFLCLYTFGVCGTNSDDYRPTSAQCTEIRDIICESEWRRAEDMLAQFEQPPLPDCSSLGQEGLECDVTVNKTECTIQCHDHFYCEDNFCKPRCDRFREYSDEYVMLSDGLMITSGSLGLVCTIAVLVLFFIRRKTLMMFPTILVFYSTISLVFVEVIVLVSFMGRPALFCSSIDLVYSLQNSAPFCKLGGIVQSFFYLQVTLLWLLNIFALYWKIQFPFHARYYDTTKRTKYIHIACVILAFVVPIFAPITISASGGFTMTRFPPIVCLGRDPDANFYTIVFPTTILYAVGLTVMLLILWRIRRHMSRHLKISGSALHIIILTPAERKIFIVLLYYTFSVALQLTTFSLSTRNINHDINAIFSYFSCQQSGENSSCTLDTAQNPFWALFALIVLLLLPSINLFFAMNLRDFRGLCRPCLTLLRRVKPKQSSVISSSVPASGPA